MAEENQRPITRIITIPKQDGSERETRLVIRKIMEVLEGHTNYLSLEETKKTYVRDTVLNQVNRLSRVMRTKNTMVFNTSEDE